MDDCENSDAISSTGCGPVDENQDVMELGNGNRASSDCTDKEASIVEVNTSTDETVRMNVGTDNPEPTTVRTDAVVGSTVDTDVGSTVALAEDIRGSDSPTVTSNEVEVPSSSEKTFDDSTLRTAPADCASREISGLEDNDVEMEILEPSSHSTVEESSGIVGSSVAVSTDIIECDSPSVISEQDLTKGDVPSSSSKTSQTYPEIMTLDTSEADSSVTEVNSVKEDTTSSIPEMITLDTTDHSSQNGDAKNDSSSLLPDIISLDTTGNSCDENIENVDGTADVSSQQKSSSPLPQFISLDSTQDSSVVSIDSGKLDSSCVIVEEKGSAKEDSPATSSMFAVDTVADNSVEELQKPSYDSSCVIVEEKGSAKEDSPATSSTFAVDTVADNSVEEMQKPPYDSSCVILEEKGSAKEDSPASPSSMFAVDTVADNSVEELQEPSYEVFIPEGMSLDIDGEEEECAVGPASRYDIVPSYDSAFLGVLTDIEYNMETGKKINDAVPKKTCFNCLGDHNVSECPEPQDPQRIAANRRKHSARLPNVRYHEDGDNKYGHFQPGIISEKLRHALGLRPNQLPIYIYRMRVLGYPPGWLRDAEVRQADIKMFDGKGRTVLHPDMEEGETDPVMVKYTPEKLVSFPGFNDPMPKGSREEGHFYNCPPMQHNHQRIEFLRFMNMNKAEAYKKRKLKDGSLKKVQTKEGDSSFSGDMEVDDGELNRSAEIQFNPPLPSEPLPPPPPDDIPEPPPPPKDLEEGEISEDSQASIGDLEEKRLRILKELEDANTQSEEEKEPKAPSSTVTPSAAENSVKKTEDVAKADKESNGVTSDPQHESENSQSSDTMESPPKKMKHHHRSHSKGFQLGAAIPQSCTPFTHLPTAEAWSVDVSDHINFENLPDALGTWDRMKGLMKQVRVKVQELQAEEDDE